jgi:hypothetical protein
MRLQRTLIASFAVWLLALTLPDDSSNRPAHAMEIGCPGEPSANPNILLCADFAQSTDSTNWDIGSPGRHAWPNARFVLCGEGFGFKDRCAAWSNQLVFDGSWGFRGYDARRSFTPASEFYVRWYQYMSDGYAWGSLEDKSLLLHGPFDTITAYVGSNRNHWPVEPHSGPGMPFVANYQDLDWPETGGAYTRINRFQNQGNDIVLEAGKWYLFEWYIRLNTPGMSDGVTKLWIDDASQPITSQTLRVQYNDMRWLRNNDAGKQFSVLRLTDYHQRCDGTPNACPPNGPEILNQSQRWDQIVISKNPIGPLIPPAVSLTSPSGDGILSGYVPVSASVHDNGDIAGVRFQLDGALLGAEDTTAPYSISWDTTTASEGSHTLTAVARDGNGNTKTSRAVSVTVGNRVTVTRHEDTSPAIIYTHSGTWMEGFTGGRNWSGGTAALGFSSSQRATFSFNGTGVSWIGERAPWTGIANVYLDGTLAATVDTYGAIEEDRAVLFTASGLGTGGHTLVIEVPEPRAKNAASSDYFVVVDALDVTVSPTTPQRRIEETDTAVAYTGGWQHGNGGEAWSGGTAALATGIGPAAQATLTFNGSAVNWVGFKGPQTGIANVYLDGTFMTAVDTYVATKQVGAVLFSAGGLAPGPHTLTVTATGTKNPLSTDPFVIVDAFDVHESAPTLDITPPEVTITSPPGAVAVSGTTPIAATAGDGTGTGVAAVQFFADGVQVGPEDTMAPYSVAWNTTIVADGVHTLRALARDVAGNTIFSAPIAITVANATPLPVPTATRFEDTDPSIAYTPGLPASGQPPAWDHGSRSRTWSNVTASFNRSAGARAIFRFSGTSVTWIGFRAFWAGIANVYLDDVFVGEIDLFLPPCTAEQRIQGCVDEEVAVPVFAAAALAPGNHVLQVEVTGRKNSAAVDYAVVVDAFDVAPALPLPVTGARLEDAASSVSYSADWTQADTSRVWSGGTAAVSGTAGARATATFAGTEVRWLGVRGPQAGIARIFVDGAFNAEVDLYAPRDIQGVVFATTGLAAGSHTLAVEVTGLRNPVATNTLVFLDALDVRSRFEERDSSFVYTGSWTKDDADNAWSGTSANAGSGTAARSTIAGARAEFTFNGTAVHWIGYRGPYAGIADVWLDGVFADRVDLYAPAEELMAPVFAATDLASGAHVLRIESTGLRNPSSIGSTVVVDAMDVVSPSPVPAVSRAEQTNESVVFTGTWTESNPNGLFSGRTVAFSGTPGSRAAFTFTGTAVRWIGQRQRDGGIALVYLDGVPVAEVDTFAATQDEFQTAVFTRSGLSLAQHTLTIEVTGRKRGGDFCTPGPGPTPPPCSGGSLVIVDAFESIH